MKHLVVGCGEVGRALMSVLDAAGHDPAAGFTVPEDTACDYLHVCIPYSANFANYVIGYYGRFSPKIVVIHSTVPIGTSDSLGANHSPIRGRHPHLVDSIRSFVKYVGGPQADHACNELRTFGIDARPCASARDTEAGKLLDLMQFAASIAVEKEIHQFCELNGLDFDLAYRDFNESYNDGYSKMGSGHFVRPVLDHNPGPIGGHCIIQNMKHVDSETAARVLKLNEQYSEQAKEATR